MTTQADLGRPVEDLADFMDEKPLRSQEDVEELAMFIAEIEGVLGVEIEESAIEVHYPLSSRDDIEDEILSHGFAYSGARGSGGEGVYVRYEMTVT